MIQINLTNNKIRVSLWNISSSEKESVCVRERSGAGQSCTCLRIPVNPGQVLVKATIPTAVSSLLGMGIVIGNVVIGCGFSGCGVCWSRRVGREDNRECHHLFLCIHSTGDDVYQTVITMCTWEE